ncbi:hypothetical protein MSG28_010487 [Choristoneura fumiferana]|uniref:Uncharacterized protein n=1 Tax=Choristoneura fumiferana TaxID=7141 RepID=A0ACC0KKS9_CHOFU|nr:hypothetical protein MSG28_010487 [Choristoneura fumiferana]
MATQDATNFLSPSVNLTIDQFQRLIGAIASARDSATAARSASFATAKFSYAGERDPTQVKNFLIAATCFKEVENMSDEDALRSLPLIFKDDAATWWNGISESVSSWTDFKDRLQSAFAPKKPAHQIYQELIGVHQKENELTEIFVAGKKDLIAQLPAPRLADSHQIDMVFGTLHKKIQDRIARESVKTLDDLLEAVRGAEEFSEEKPLPAKRKRVRCRYCKNLGHSQDVCRKKQAEVEIPSTSSQPAILEKAPSPPAPKVSCYGCGAPGLVRSTCPTCSKRIRVLPFKKEDIMFC